MKQLPERYWLQADGETHVGPFDSRNEAWTWSMDHQPAGQYPTLVPESELQVYVDCGGLVVTS